VIESWIHIHSGHRPCAIGETTYTMLRENRANVRRRQALTSIALPQWMDRLSCSLHSGDPLRESASPSHTSLLLMFIACTMRHLHLRGVMDESKFQSLVRVGARPIPNGMVR